MKKLFTPRWLLAELTGLLFAAYAAYNVFIIFRDIKGLPPEGILISSIVALMFVILAVFMWTAGIKGKKHILFMMLRRGALIVALLVIFALKIRLVDRVIAYLDFSKFYTVLYGGAYFLTLAALLILLVYYIFILKNLPFYPEAAMALPVSAIILFLLCLILEAIMFFAYGIGLEANTIRTVVMRPVFYLGFVGLSLHFLYPLPIAK